MTLTPWDVAQQMNIPVREARTWYIADNGDCVAYDAGMVLRSEDEANIADHLALGHPPDTLALRFAPQLVSAVYALWSRVGRRRHPEGSARFLYPSLAPVVPLYRAEGGRPSCVP